MKDVVNVSDGEITAYFDGQNIYFKAGQKKQFADGVADEIVRETQGLVFEEDVVEVAEKVESAPEVVVESPEGKGK